MNTRTTTTKKRRRGRKKKERGKTPHRVKPRLLVCLSIQRTASCWRDCCMHAWDRCGNGERTRKHQMNYINKNEMSRMAKAEKGRNDKEFWQRMLVIRSQRGNTYIQAASVWKWSCKEKLYKSINHNEMGVVGNNQVRRLPQEAEEAEERSKREIWQQQREMRFNNKEVTCIRGLG
jgi:hypothetical protein